MGFLNFLATLLQFGHSLRNMGNGIAEIIRQIENQRDEFVARCNAAIHALSGGQQETGPSEYRFTPKLASRGSIAKPRGRTKSSESDANEPVQQTGDVEPKSVKDMIRLAVRSQTQPFTLREIRAFMETRFPGPAAGISSGRYSKELYHLRVTEKQFEICSKGEKGGAHVYKLNVA